VTQPADTEDLYFVADGNGGHVFARTLDDHNRNVGKLRKVQAHRDSEAAKVNPSAGSGGSPAR
jgi:UPF0755 protein